MNIIRSLQKWGNGNGVQLPKEVIEAAHIKVNQPLEVSTKGSSIILTPVKETNKITLESLLEGATPATVGGELDWGDDIGNERYE